MRTRNYFTVCALLFLFATSGHSQRRGLLQNLYNSTVYSNNYNNGVSYSSYSYNSDGYRDRDYGYAYERYYHRMSRSDRRCFDDLLRKLDRRKRRAWEDGRLSIWDRERIRNVEIEIDNLIDRYAYDRRRSENRRYDNSRTYRPGCR